MSAAPDEDLLPLDSTCPHCHYESDIGEIYDGGEHRCEHCNAYLNAASFGPSPQSPRGRMIMVLVSGPPIAPLSGRARTRKRWARMGRR